MGRLGANRQEGLATRAPLSTESGEGGVLQRLPCWPLETTQAGPNSTTGETEVTTQWGEFAQVFQLLVCQDLD